MDWQQSEQQQSGRQQSEQQETDRQTAPVDGAGQAPKHSAVRWRWLSVVLLLAALGIGTVFLTQPDATAQSDAADDAPAQDAAAQDAAGNDAPAQDAIPGAADVRAARETLTPVNAVEYPLPHRIRLPNDALDGGVEWLNTSGPIELPDLRGKIVLIDFWTYCCINCIHILPDLKYLEEKYADQLVVIGCHSAKFENEKESKNIREAIMRYEIEHPVVNDANMTIWRRFGIRSWPSLLLIDAEGQACLLLSGEGQRETLDKVIGQLIAYHRAKGTLDETPVRFDLERHDQEPTPLRYPGKILADAEGGRLFISDSNHNRIVVTTPEGKLLDVIGSGAIGSKDGGYAEASFDHPQGMALVGNTLYVADTENHMIRAVDLEKKTVSTFAGTGKQAEFRAAGGNLRRTALNSPWDLLHVDGTLYVAMAGPHQIWSHKIGSNEIRVFAGSGREDIINGPHHEAALAQPSGLASDGKFLYVCDSEGSAIRQISLNRTGGVKTLVGPSDLPLGRSLFEFGDINGKGGAVRLQHPLGVAHRDGTLFIADSYNHKIKQIDIVTATAKPFLGTGKPGTTLEGRPQFSEPAGLAILGDSLFIADTNNHRVLVADLNSKQVRELKIEGLQPPRKTTDEKVAEDGGKPTSVGAQRVAPGTELEFRVTLAVPAGYKVNALYPVRYKIEADGEPALVASEHLGQRHEAELTDQTASFRVPLTAAEGRGNVTVSLTYGYCRGGAGGLCKINTARWSVPLIVAQDATGTSVALTVPAATVK